MTGRTRHEIAQHEAAMDRFLAGSVRCPRCGAAARTEERDAEPCQNPVTGLVLRNGPGHWQRIRLAREGA